MSDKIIIAIFTTSGAFIGVIFGALFTYFTSRHTAQININADRRLSWIKSFSDSVSEFVGSLLTLRELSRQKTIDRGEWLPSFRKATALLTRIKLLLNPNDKIHKKLIDQIEQAIKLASDQNSSHQEVSETNAFIIEIAQQVVHQTWTTSA